MINMVERKDCRYFYYGNKKLRGIDSPTASIIKMPSCKINKNTVGGCNPDCRWFESK